MKNLEQIRAAAAIEAYKGLDKAAVNKLPALILTNGLLATVAFCKSASGADSRSHMKKALEATAEHLVSQRLLTGACKDLEGLSKALSDCDSIHLQRATEESLAFVGYLRRFAEKRATNPEK